MTKKLLTAACFTALACRAQVCPSGAPKGGACVQQFADMNALNQSTAADRARMQLMEDKRAAERLEIGNTSLRSRMLELETAALTDSIAPVPLMAKTPAAETLLPPPPTLVGQTPAVRTLPRALLAGIPARPPPLPAPPALVAQIPAGRLLPHALLFASADPAWPVPALQETGVRLTSTPPGADVFVDGQYWGHTPTAELYVEAGVHAIALRKLGYKLWERKLDLGEGGGEIISAGLEVDPKQPRIANLE